MSPPVFDLCWNTCFGDLVCSDLALVTTEPALILSLVRGRGMPVVPGAQRALSWAAFTWKAGRLASFRLSTERIWHVALGCGCVHAVFRGHGHRQ